MKFVRLLWFVVCTSSFFASGAEKYAELNPRRIDALEAMIPESPAGFGRPITDRAAWEDLNKRKVFNRYVSQAEKFLSVPFPKWDDDAYLEFSKTGKRPAGEKMMNARSGWLAPLVLAECVENKGRFVEKINDILDEFVKEPTWTMPAHDRDLKNFKREFYSVDLRSSAFSHSVAEALYLLGEKIKPDTRKRVMDAMEARIFEPIRNSARNGKSNSWMKAEMNWNAVCLAGVVGAALTVLPERKDRALFAAIGEHYSAYYLKGFPEDGYCLEGAGYWDYGFSNFILLREKLLQYTGGKVDLFNDSKLPNIALFGVRVVMVNGAAPPFGDCHFGTKPDLSIVNYCNRVLGLGLKGFEDMPAIHGDLASMCMEAFPNSAAEPKKAESSKDELGLRTYFEKAGVLVERPAPGSNCRLGVGIKAGGNGNHSHDDVGSFAIAIGTEEPVGEPGGPNYYSGDMFSAKRRTFKIINSYGHPVPLIAGRMQLDATKVHPKVLKTDFTDKQDEFVIDMACSYDVPDLKKLIRTMRYNREGAGWVSIEDHFELSKPESFEISLPTRGKVQTKGPHTFEFTMGKETLTAEVEAPGEMEPVTDTIEENGPPFTRLGLRLKSPVESGTIKVTFKPQ